ncbi:MAG: bis(5'-nucleosyl)-tetraphosphatase (symmetrical) YqeK [[Ruminococcus] torques]
MKEELLHIKKELSKKLKKERFEHTVGVMYTSASLAMRYGANIEKAMTAGLLHDCGKYCSAKEQLKLCEKYKITLTDLEHSMPALIHTNRAIWLKQYGIKDRSARCYHLSYDRKTGNDNVGKILYIADYIEPNRREIPGLSKIRQIVFQNIDQAICLSSERTIRYLEDNGNKIDPMTIKTYEFYGGKL